MNISEMKKIGDKVGKDVSDQIDTIRSIKGERYARSVEYMMKLLSLNRAIAVGQTPPSTPAGALRVLMMASITTDTISILANMFFEAQGYKEEEEADKEILKEVVADAERLIESALKRGKSMMK